MRKISAKVIRDAVRDLAIEANIFLRKDISDGLKKALRAEKNLLAKNVLKMLIENADIAKKRKIAICQDTGMAVVFCEIGEQAYVGSNITKAINDGIKIGYEKGFLRKSVVSGPLLRENTKTNTPAVIHYNFAKGNKIKITVIANGFGCENASRLVMLKPTDGEKEIIDFAVKTVEDNGANACPPLILGIGIGGTMDKSASLAKEALIKPITSPNPKKHLARIEREVLARINKTGIGPAGLGGKATCLGVNILSFPTHIAGLPVCVKVSCHATRSATKVI